MTTPAPQPAALLAIQWKTLSVALAILTLAALTTTVIVASIRDVDVLSVVALALAVVAFVVQILVYIVQSASTENQTQHWSNLYTQMTSALATIEEKSERTRDAVDRLDPARVRQAVDKAASEAVSANEDGEGNRDGESPEQQMRSLSRRVSELLQTQQPSQSRQPSQPLQTFLDKPMTETEMRRAARAAAQLKESDIVSMRRLATDQRRQERDGTNQIGLAVVSRPDSLYEQGLVVKRVVDWSERPVFQLTELGQGVARVLLAPPPEVLELEDYAKLQETLQERSRVLHASRLRSREREDAIPTLD